MNFYLFSYINSIEKKLGTNRSSQNGYQFFMKSYRFWNFPQSGHLIQLRPSIGIISLLHS